MLAILALFFMLYAFITLCSENTLEIITLHIEYLGKPVNRKLRSIKIAFKETLITCMNGLTKF